MQIIETNSDGLKRELKVVIGAGELASRMEAKLGEIQGKAHLKGFRPGKAPLSHIRKAYGRSVMAEVVQQAVNETTEEALMGRDVKPAFQPVFKLPEDQAVVERVMAGSADLEYVMSFEVLPKIDLADLKSIALEKLVAEPSDEDIAKSLDQLRDANTGYEAKDGPAETGDRVTIDFKGSIDGEPFEGGAAEDAPVILGRGRFIPGFEDGLMGAKAGDAKTISVTFPEDYGAAHLAGKPAEFEVTVKEVARPVTPEATDEFAKSLGLESIEKLRGAIRDRIVREYDTVSRTKLKKALLDALDEKHKFELPPSLVSGEFNAIWTDIGQQMARSGKTFEDEGTTEDKARADYQSIAERRVRLGLLLSEIGQRNDIKIGDEDIKRAIIERARQYPGQESQVVEFYKKNPNAVAELRAPVYEEKVVSFALELVKVTEKSVSPEELLRAGEHDHECGPDCDHDHHHHG
ncbi:MAG: trigger factor [Hyphomicrobiales bacterium]|nr:trigger factor [Hyphomicrobiales bacterium]